MLVQTGCFSRLKPIKVSSLLQNWYLSDFLFIKFSFRYGKNEIFLYTKNSFIRGFKKKIINSVQKREVPETDRLLFVSVF